MKQMLTHTHTHTHTQENKKWEIKTWEKWFWGIVEVVFLILLSVIIILDRCLSTSPNNWKSYAKDGSVFFLIWSIIFLIIWGITKLIIWLVNRNKKEIDN